MGTADTTNRDSGHVRALNGQWIQPAMTINYTWTSSNNHRDAGADTRAHDEVPSHMITAYHE